jgi:hypothetical protein
MIAVPFDGLYRSAANSSYLDVGVYNNYFFGEARMAAPR